METVSDIIGDTMSKDIKEVLPDPAHGPLTEFRKRGTFDWRKMKIHLETEDMIRYKYHIWSLLRNDPLFEHPNKSLSVNELKHLTTKRMYAFHNKNMFSIMAISSNLDLIANHTEAVLLYDSSLVVKLSLTFKMFSNVVMGMGVPEQYKYVEAVEKGDIGGCFALTEIAHGSNAKQMRTTATFQPETKDFLLNTPDFEAAKCWVGSLGKCATHAIVYAQLVSKDVHHGLHAFIVPIRCPKSLKPHSGVIVGDMGEKIGLNGVDNGFVMFNNYRLPFENQLSRQGGVNKAGDYVSPIKDPNRRFGAALGVLSGGRVSITGMAATYLQKGVVIAIRYAAIRRQFSDTSNISEESPIIDYQSVQMRILPYLASAFALKMFSYWFARKHIAMTFEGFATSKSSESAQDMAALGMEIHGLSSAVKPFSSWIARDGLQTCRELCAGHGYLLAAGIGPTRNDNDANCTYEGENSILVQQTMNWLLTLWSKRHETSTFDTPLRTVNFLKDADKILKLHCHFNSSDDAVKPENLLNAYKWLFTYMLKATDDKYEALRQIVKDPLKAKNDSQSYFAMPTAIIYAEHAVLTHFFETVSALDSTNEKKVLLNLVSLFGAWLLEKHMGTLYMGGYWRDQKTGEYLREGVIQLCKKVASEAVLLADVLAPPDFILNSVLGASNGEMYKNLQTAIFTAPDSLSRPNWWQDVVNWKAYVPSKL